MLTLDGVEEQPKDPAGAVRSATDTDRGTGGLFAKGNQVAKGNLQQKRLGAFRAALTRAITDEDIAAVVQKLIAFAKGGCEHDSDTIAAQRLLLSYAVGKPPDVDGEIGEQVVVVFRRPAMIDGDQGDSIDSQKANGGRAPTQPPL